MGHFVALLEHWRRGVQGPEHRNRQNEGHGEGDWNVEVLTHYARLLVMEIKRNKWL